MTDTPSPSLSPARFSPGSPGSPGSPAFPPTPLSLVERLWFAWVVFFRVLLDGSYAAALRSPPTLPEALPPAVPKTDGASEANLVPARLVPARVERPHSGTDAALQLLALLQREGRFVDFIEEDVAALPDADIGAAARVVHAGCRKALREHLKLEPVHAEEEGARVTLRSPLDADSVKLTGNVRGAGPFTGTLRHKGWRAAEITLPTNLAGHDPRVLAQAEVEL